MERARMLNILKSFYSHFMKKDRKKSILDLGCGDGIMAYEILKTDGAISFAAHLQPLRPLLRCRSHWRRETLFPQRAETPIF
jgi:hypothetical protein